MLAQNNLAEARASKSHFYNYKILENQVTRLMYHILFSTKRLNELASSFYEKGTTETLLGERKLLQNYSELKTFSINGGGDTHVLQPTQQVRS